MTKGMTMFYIKLFLCILGLTIPLSSSWAMEKESSPKDHKKNHLRNLKTLGQKKHYNAPNDYISDYKKSAKEDDANPRNKPKTTVVTVKTGEIALLDPSSNHEQRKPDASFTTQHACLDYVDFLNIDELHKQGLNGQGTKIAIIDSWFDYRAPNIRDALSKSTIEEEPKEGSIQAAQNQRRVFRGPGKGHGNHISSIVTTIAPQAEIKYINFAERLATPNPSPPYMTARDIYNVLLKTLSSAHKPDFINISFKLPEEGDADSQVTDTLFLPLHPLIEEALLQIADHNIGIIVAFGNDGQSEIESDYLKSLVDLANNPKMKGRLLLASASQIEKGVEEIYERSNYVLYPASSAHLLTAPGYNIAALGPQGFEMVKSGTSQSAPMITATASLIKQFLATQQRKKPSHILPEEVFDLMLASARDKDYTGSCSLDTQYGQGILNPLGAIRMARKFHP